MALRLNLDPEDKPKPSYTMESKPTVYKGIQFRSRLESRWAIFFDTLQIKWIYEPRSIFIECDDRVKDVCPCEPQNCPGYIYYTPDFYLPDFDQNVEIKGTYDAFMDERFKYIRAATHLKNGLIVGGAMKSVSGTPMYLKMIKSESVSEAKLLLTTISAKHRFPDPEAKFVDLDIVDGELSYRYPLEPKFLLRRIFTGSLYLNIIHDPVVHAFLEADPIW